MHRQPLSPPKELHSARSLRAVRRRGSKQSPLAALGILQPYQSRPQVDYLPRFPDLASDDCMLPALDVSDDEDATSSASMDVPSLLACVSEPDPLYAHMEERNMLAAQCQRIFNTLSKESSFTQHDITLTNTVSDQ